jgi:hypothetical protein
MEPFPYSQSSDVVKIALRTSLMQLARPIIAPDPRRFGRGRLRELALNPPRATMAMSDDLKLFASTFAAGFLIVSVLIA